MPRELTKTEKGALGVFGTLAAIFGIRKLIAGKQPPPPPPPPDLATLWGIVKGKQSKLPIENIQVACNGYTAITDMSGRFEIPNITPGIHTVLFTDPLGRYEPLEV